MVFLAIYLCVLAALLSHYIDAPPAKFGTLMASIISIMVNKRVIDAELPDISILTMVEKIEIFSFLLLIYSLVIGTYAVQGNLDDKGKARLKFLNQTVPPYLFGAFLAYNLAIHIMHFI